MGQLNDDLESIVRERDNIERRIKNVTAEPFIAKQEGKSMATRIATLNSKLNEKEKIAGKHKHEENEKLDELEKKKTEIMKLEAQVEAQKSLHEEARRKFNTETRADVNYTEVIRGFYHSDEKKFSNTLSDLHMEGNDKLTPLWADLDFLDHGEFGDNDLIKEKDEEKAIRNQISKLEQMKVDLDAEYSKS